MCQTLQPHSSKLEWFGLIPVRSPLLGEYFLFLRVLRCFSSPGSRLPVYVFNRRRHRFAVAGFPIRTSPDRSLYTAPRGLSQCPTSFIGAWRQGILRKLLVASPRDAEKLILFCFGLHHQITIQLVRCKFAVDWRTTLSTSVQGVGHPSNSPVADTIRPGFAAGSRKIPMLAVHSNVMSADRSTIFFLLRSYSTNSVEMTGFEPVAFALQRRCSPAELHPQNQLVGLTGFEPVTPVLSGLCSNQLSYKPASARRLNN